MIQINSFGKLLCACGLLLMSGPVTRVWADGACCTETACQNVATELACNALLGVYLPGADCGNNACGPGACCAPLSCSIASAFPCITSGREFGGVGTTCLDDPCADGVGACCNSGVCALQSSADCAAGGGTWLGAGTNCVNNQCIVGACCMPGACEDLAIFQCNAVDGEFVGGAGCAPGACVLPEDCPADALFGQSPVEAEFIAAYTSEFASGLIRYENFSGVPGPMVEMRWFGLDMFFTGGGFEECVELDNTFIINVYDDVEGMPGPNVCSYFAQATSTPLEQMLENVVINEYHLVLPTPCVTTNGWVSLGGFGDSDCWFLWLRSTQGDNYSLCDNCQSEIQGVDLALCLEGVAAETGDLDFDGDVDLSDAATFIGCLHGPDVPSGGACSFADLESDGDVDLRDARDWVNSFIGEL